jgi:hypothetical protein
MFRARKRRRSWSSLEQTLASAADLVAAEKPIDAIRLLTEANRVERDRRVEHRLVELRYEAFRVMNLPRTPPVWPEVVEDLFPGELIPEVARENLTVECLRSAIRNHGSLIVRGLVDRDHVDRLVSDIDMTFDAFDADASGNPRPDLAGWYVRFEHEMLGESRNRDRGTVLAVESPPTLFDLIETLNDVGVGQLARDYFGEPPMVLARKVTLRHMPHTASGGWHQDGAFMGVDIRSLNVWMPLTHCGDDAPGLDVVARRLDYLVQTGNGTKYPWAISPEDAEQASAGAVVRPIFDPGDALIFDHLCLHRTGRDAWMKKGRYAIETWLFAPSTYAAMTTPLDTGYSPRDQLPIVF